MEIKEKKEKQIKYKDIMIADLKEAEDRLHGIFMEIEKNDSLLQEDYKDEIHNLLKILLAILPEEYDGYTTNGFTIIRGTRKELDNLPVQGKEELNIADDMDYFRHTQSYNYMNPEKVVAQIPIP